MKKPAEQIDRLLKSLDQAEDPAARAELVQWLEKDRQLVEDRLDRRFGPRVFR